MADEQKTEMENKEQVETQEQPKEEPKDKEALISQSEVDKIIERRLARERSKYEKLYEGINPDEARNLKEEKEKIKLEEQKKRGEFEDILKQQADKSNSEIDKLKSEIESIKIDGSLLTSASKHKAINPKQVSDLLRTNVKLSDDGRVEVLAENNQPRYNKEGELLSIDDYVSEFITQNPHFQSATPRGSGSKANVGTVDAKPFNIADLDMTKPEDRKRYAEYKKDRDSKPTVIDLTRS